MPKFEREISEARALVRKGKLKPAISLLMEAGAVEEAVRILVKANRFEEAAIILLNGVGASEKDYNKLDTLKTRYVSLAASLYAKAKKVDEAVRLLTALGHTEKAAGLLDKAGKKEAAAKLRKKTQVKSKTPAAAKGRTNPFGNNEVTAEIAERLVANKKYDLAIEAYLQLRQRDKAAKIAEKTGKIDKAAKLYAEAGMHFEAAVCFMKIRDKEQCLSNLVKVPKEHAKYRAACHNAIRLAENLDLVDFQTEYLLAEFVQSGPKSEKEVPYFFALAQLYQRHNLPDNAVEAVEEILLYDPKFPGAKELLKELEASLKSELDEGIKRVVADDQAFQTASKKKKKDDVLPGLPELPDLPGLPNLPPLPQAPAPAATEAGSAQNMATVATVATQRSDITGHAPAAQQSTRHEDIFVPGGIIDDRYRIDKKIGQGGMAMVFRADDMELDETVALKVFIRPIEDEETLERFKQELRLSRKLSHPNVIRLHDIGVYLGHRYLSMEFLQGKDLQDYMGKPMELQQGLDLLIQVCDGLEVAHQEGVIHRDMKPPNVFVTTKNIAKVMDFGIAKNTAAEGLTQAGLIFGTPQYMSPEQINDPRKVGPGTDLYAVGIMAYQMFTGSLPFNHPELVTLLMMQANQPAEPPRMRNENIPEELEQLIMKLMNKLPEDRHQTCAELASELRSLKKQFAT